MANTDITEPDDLTGSVDQRIEQLAALEDDGTPLPAEWLRRQLTATLAAWAADETEIDIESETHVDY